MVDVEEVVESAWQRTVEDFEMARRSGDAWLWREATLKLAFSHRLCEFAKLERVIAEAPYRIGRRENTRTWSRT
jgi:hypothetical protein